MTDANIPLDNCGASSYLAPSDNAIATSEQKTEFLKAISDAKRNGEVIVNRQAFLDQIDLYEKETLAKLYTTQRVPLFPNFITKILNGPEAPQRKESKTFVFEAPDTKQVEVAKISVFSTKNSDEFDILRIIENKNGGDASGVIDFSQKRELDHQWEGVSAGGWQVSGLATDTKIDFDRDGEIDEAIIRHKREPNSFNSRDEHHIDANKDGFIDFVVMRNTDYSLFSPFTQEVTTIISRMNSKGFPEFSVKTETNSNKNMVLDLTGYKTGHR